MGLPLDKVTLPRRALNYRGIVHLQAFFLIMKNWLEDHRYEFHEHTVKSKLYSDGLRREYRWYAWKDINEYIKFEINIFMDIRNMQEVEVIREGKKQKLTQCRIIWEVQGVIHFDPDKRFGGSKFLQTLQDFFHNYVIKKEIIFIWMDQLDYRIMKLQRVVKEYLEFETKTSAYERKW